MDVKVYAFNLSFRHGITIDNLFNYIKEIGITDAAKLANYLENGGEKPNIKKIITTSSRSSHPDYIVGLSLTIKDVTAFCALKGNNGKLEVTAEQLSAGTLMTDFNFFIVYKPTGRGLYQHYFHSQATTTFCKLLKDHYNELRMKLVSSEAARLKVENGLTEKNALSLAKKKYFHYLACEVIERPEDVGQLIQELERIDSLIFEPVTYEDFMVFGRSSQGLIKKIKPKIIFEKSTNLIEMCKSLASSIFSGNDIRNATVKGIDINGSEATIKLKNDYQVLHKYDYNDLVVTISFDDIVTSLDNANIITQLLNLSQAQSIKSLLELREN